MQTDKPSKSNKPLKFWDRLKIAKRNRLATEDYMKSHGVSFLRELCGVSSKLPDISRLQKLIGYLHYEAGLSLLQISNDLGLENSGVVKSNTDLLGQIGVSTGRSNTSIVI